MKYPSQIFSFSILKTFTVKLFISFCLTCCVPHAFAQVTDDFSDGDFARNPAWTGDEAKFSVSSSHQLRLQAPAATATAYLVTANAMLNNTQWEFRVNLDFNPSSSNYIRIYLTSDQPDISDSVNGYFVMIGNTADEISLYRQNGNTKTKIIDGTDGSVNSSSVTAKIKVTRDASGNWKLFSDVGTTGSFIEEGAVTDTRHLSSRYFGIFCNYTSTRADKFYFDDITITAIPVVDTEAPFLQAIQVLSAHELNLRFSESLDRSSAETITNYHADHTLGNPSAIILQPDQINVRLFFTQNFPNGVPCALTLSGIKDLTGNSITSADTTFLFFETMPAKKKDIIITEIFADPSPQVELPEAEFIEIFNRSTSPFDLNDWKLSDGSSTADLKNLILLPGEYMILTATSSASAFAAYGNVMAVSNFPALNNTRDSVILKDDKGIVIDAVDYDNSLYHDADKKDGGWSLELIDPDNACSGNENWTASGNEKGGTPGKQNAVFASKPDLTGPKLLTAIPVSSNQIVLLFDEKLNEALPAIADVVVEPSVAVENLMFADRSLTKLNVNFSEPLQNKILYTIDLQNIRDCSGNTIGTDFAHAIFAVPERADSLDVIVNELLFNPRPAGVDFVEIVNTSDKYINLKSWSIANLKNDTIKNATPISKEDLLLKPGGYLVFTEDANTLKGEYLQSHDETFLETPLPGFSDDEGSVVLVNDQGDIIDYFRYTETLHSVFIKNNEGVSLERIAFDQPTNETQNWKSASSISGFATPGYLNSNAATASMLLDESIKIEPEIFIPVSGQPDFTQIWYRFNQGGFVANVKIYDAQGHMIKLLASNELLGTEGFFRWDGDKDDGSKARIGYYMAWVEIFDTNGMVTTFRKRVVIAGTF